MNFFENDGHDADGHNEANVHNDTDEQINNNSKSKGVIRILISEPTIERVVQVHKNAENGNLICRLKYLNEDMHRYLPIHIAHERFPHKLIEYYESLVFWRSSNKGELCKMIQ